MLRLTGGGEVRLKKFTKQGLISAFEAAKGIFKILARAIIEENKKFEILHFIGNKKCMK